MYKIQSSAFLKISFIPFITFVQFIQFIQFLSSLRKIIYDSCDTLDFPEIRNDTDFTELFEVIL